MTAERLDGKVIVITGASSGFGKGAARKMAALGASLVLAARREEILGELIVECNNLGGNAIAVPADVSKLADVELLCENAMSQFGRIDVWINNAGAAAIGKFTEVPIEDHVQVVSTDLLGTMFGSYSALQVFEQQGSGTLINVASMIGRIPAPYYASYAASKHGVLGLSGALRQELAEQKMDKIHVCTVLPMAMNTPFFEHAANYTGKESVPIPPVSEAEEVCQIFVDLIFHPKAEVAVGKGALIFSASDAIVPGITESLMAKSTHKSQIKDASPAQPTAGALRRPSSKGTGVHARQSKNQKPAGEN